MKKKFSALLHALVMLPLSICPLIVQSFSYLFVLVIVSMPSRNSFSHLCQHADNSKQ
ncbi:hypothetical protein JXQ70_14325 [bacterium]|nr:hypothetical protein [bacterium]